MPADRPVGHRQTAALRQLCGVTIACVSPREEHAALVRLGLLRKSEAGSVCITPAGLRKAADLLEAGKIKDALTVIAERRARDQKETDNAVR